MTGSAQNHLNVNYKIIIMKEAELNSSILNEEVEISSKKTKKKVPVYLNIYNFNALFNRCCSCINLGVYHTGIEV
jgi:hypothetical protein